MTHIAHVNLDPKYIKDGTEVVICSNGSSFHGLTGHIVGVIDPTCPYINVVFDARSRKILKKHGLGGDAGDISVPFSPRELCVVQDDPEEDDTQSMEDYED